MQTVSINAEKRTVVGSADAKKLRAQELIPAVMYGGDGVTHCTVSPKSLKPLIYTPDFKIAEINIDNTIEKCIVKDVQFHPVSDAILHIDFLKLVPKNTIKINIPVKFNGVSPGVKAGGKLVQSLRKVPIKTTPEHLIDELFVSISKLELGQSVRVRDIVVPEGIEIMSNGSIPVASIEIPRALKSAAAAEAKTAVKGKAPAKPKA
jgi:large subunit ribosomal protein L25